MSGLLPVPQSTEYQLVKFLVGHAGRHSKRPDVQPVNARPYWSRTRRVGMLTLRGYLLISALMLPVKATELAPDTEHQAGV